MTKPAPGAPRLKVPLRPADVRGLSRLGVDAVVGVTDLVETMHHTIASVSGITGRAPDGRPSGITGFVYRAVRGTARTVGQGLDVLWGALPFDTATSTPEREAFVAALNGVWGDHLVDTGNPLAIPMSLRIGGRPYRQALANARPTGKLLVLVHGLAMNDLQWSRRGHDHGQALARDLGFTPVYLHYNSGLHVSQNGRAFAALLDDLVADWPVPVDELVIVCHSMGGLVTRSACSVAEGRPWMAALRKLVFLGTPHHGAPLERGGRLVDTLLGVSPYVAPFARLGKTRSAGITDLRFGNLQDADWQHRDRHAQKQDDRRPTPLPDGVQCFLVAATTSAQSTGLRSAMLGDGLVPVASALGVHRDPKLALNVPQSHQMVVTAANHWDLLSRGDVYQQIRTWLT
ncbi:MAG TPA: alpha/beta hydrolase [Ideonella sp.]|uniref:esterase/lipase family protein n=1 Tax=Ideonella sp. TaxID=1929293 RepID=UPI002E3693DB|nr:alpha/beta hydrolase [Ideonella sp.]HEX5682802.1 alpha/beta hydrolase [Ideonella sp.]